jgi:transmembrane sensor
MMEVDAMKNLLSTKSRLGLGLTGLVLVLVVISSSVMLYSNSRDKIVAMPIKQVYAYSTPKDVHQQVHLTDGSILSMSGDTHVTVHFAGDSRVIKLYQGQIDVAAVDDPSRPMIVEGGSGKVLASGNVFKVKRDGGVMDVAVAMGSVKVNGGTVLHPTSKYVNEGMRIQVSQASELSDLRRID